MSVVEGSSQSHTGGWPLHLRSRAQSTHPLQHPFSSPKSWRKGWMCSVLGDNRRWIFDVKWITTFQSWGFLRAACWKNHLLLVRAAPCLCGPKACDSQVHNHSSHLWGLQLIHLLNSIFGVGVDTNNMLKSWCRVHTSYGDHRGKCKGSLGLRTFFFLSYLKRYLPRILVCGALLSNLMGRVLLHPFCCCGVRFLCRPSNSFAFSLLSNPPEVHHPLDHKNVPFFNFATISKLLRDERYSDLYVVCECRGLVASIWVAWSLWLGRAHWPYGPASSTAR